MSRVMDEEFKVEHQVTIGVEFGSFVIKLDEKIIKLQIWDTAGQESFRSVTRIFYKGAHVVFLCFDLTREDTFNHLTTWLNDIRAHASAEIVVYLIGSKVDLVEQREVDKETARAFCEEHRIEKYFETSSVTGFNVEEVFSMAAKDLYVRECVSNAPPTPSNDGGNAGGGKDGKKPAGGSGTKGTVNLNKKAPGLADKKKKDGCC